MEGTTIEECITNLVVRYRLTDYDKWIGSTIRVEFIRAFDWIAGVTKFLCYSGRNSREVMRMLNDFSWLQAIKVQVE